ncbi:MAG: hypothetical protein GY847_21480 [Proteobacteria bacterium]|nr:hypothetical protein [Pseudomonadota bacterium]
MKKSCTVLIAGFIVVCGAWIISCSDDDGGNGGDGDSDSDTDSDTDIDTDTDSDSDTDIDTDIDTDTDSDLDTFCDNICKEPDGGTGESVIPPRPDDETVSEGGYCYMIDHCNKEDRLYCDSYQIVPPDLSGTCQKCSSDKSKWIVQGTVQDMITAETVPNITFKFTSANQALLQRCAVAPFYELTSKECGEYCGVQRKSGTTSAPLAPIGTVALVCNQEDYHNSASGVSDPPYRCGVRQHGVIVVRKDKLTEWSEMLEADDEMKNFMPLGKRGGAIIHIMDVDKEKTGIPNAQLKSRAQNSTAKIRYLNEAMDGWVSDKTSSNGFAVVVNAQMAEKFDSYIGDEKISHIEATIGTIPSIIGIFVIPIEADEKGL